MPTWPACRPPAGRLARRRATPACPARSGANPSCGCSTIPRTRATACCAWWPRPTAPAPAPARPSCASSASSTRGPTPLAFASATRRCRGADGDPVIQTFYAVAPLRHDFDPEFSEIDWEYLPNGGWGSEKTRLYGISWQTVRIEPWLAYNGSHEEMGALGAGDAAWHVLLMQVAGGRVRLFLDGRQVAEHGGRNYPVVPMSINFNLWFSPGGLLPAGGPVRRYEQDVDWVFHARNEVLSPAQVEAAVAAYRRQGRGREDTVPAAQPALDSRCDF